MKILMASTPINHFFNWVLQLEDSGHEIYWFDVSASNAYEEKIDFLHQIVFWKRKFEYPGRYWIKKNLPSLNVIIEKFNRREFKDVFEKKLRDIKPDVVHSFEIHYSAIPIFEIMKNHPEIKWIYSPWGNDLFYYQNEPAKLKEIKAVLSHLDYMFADCVRDHKIAKKLGFKGHYLGTFPGGGGYDLKSYNSLVYKLENRKTIIVKGYEHEFGRAINILKALIEINAEIREFQIVVFAATDEVLKFVQQNQKQFSNMDNLVIKGRIGRDEVLELMGKSFLYVGNSIADGIPNTLLEALIMEAFPIQSNPGGATAEIIEHGKNGFLIKNPEDIKEIALLIKRAIQDPELLKSATAYNTANIKPMLERNYIKNQVLKKYKLVEKYL